MIALQHFSLSLSLPLSISLFLSLLSSSAGARVSSGTECNYLSTAKTESEFGISRAIELSTIRLSNNPQYRWWWWWW
uniref:Putative secreted protein n=1 Tax=Anopheles marajoara TaxID=58244 RepID=A0A2M4CCF1_9DIPT